MKYALENGCARRDVSQLQYYKIMLADSHADAVISQSLDYQTVDAMYHNIQMSRIAAADLRYGIRPGNYIDRLRRTGVLDPTIELVLRRCPHVFALDFLYKLYVIFLIQYRNELNLTEFTRMRLDVTQLFIRELNSVYLSNVMRSNVRLIQYFPPYSFVGQLCFFEYPHPLTMPAPTNFTVHATSILILENCYRSTSIINWTLQQIFKHCHISVHIEQVTYDSVDQCNKVMLYGLTRNLVHVLNASILMLQTGVWFATTSRTRRVLSEYSMLLGTPLVRCSPSNKESSFIIEPNSWQCNALYSQDETPAM